MIVDLLLSRLSNVRCGQDGWRADCPCDHRHARGSLSVAVAKDGRLLLHDFAGCEVHSVLDAVGLNVADLFPERVRDPSPDAMRRAREAARRNGWLAALAVLVREATVVLAAAGMLHRGHALTADDDIRLALAMQRIENARVVLA